MKSTMMMPPRLRRRSWRAMAPGGLEVGLEDRLVEVARADEAAGVDVDGRQRLGLVDDEVAAALQVDAARERAGDLLLDVEEVEDRAARPCSARAGRPSSTRTSRRTRAARRAAACESMRIVCVLSLAMSRSTRSARLRSWCSSEPAGSRQRAFADAVPGGAQVGDVLGQLLVAGLLGVGAQDEAAAAVGRVAGQRDHARAQLLAQLVRADALRDADVVVVRQVDQQPARDAHLRGQARALGADRILDHLHGERLALEHQLLDGRGRALGLGRRMAVQVGHVQEGRALQADVDEGRLHAGQHARHLAEIDVADQAALQRALEMQFLDRAVLDDRHARLLGRPVDQDVVHAMWSRYLYSWN